MATQFTIQQGDITKVQSDLLLLKYAEGFHGADMVVADLLTARGVCSEAAINPRLDDFALVPTKGSLAPAQVMFLGTPHLRNFSYGEMRHFASRAIEILFEQGLTAPRLTTTIHGVNYGLDASEALQSLVRGFQEGLARHPNCRIEQIVFVEKRERTARILKSALEGLHGTSPSDQASTLPVWQKESSPKPVASENGKNKPVSVRPTRPVEREEPVKKHVFVAMPFAEEFQDIYEFGIYGPIRRCGFICERVDESSFTGDILQRITQRISTAEFVVADLTGAKANVYLEVGYAWGKEIPVITLAREGEKLHFDVSRHRCIFYRTIGHLAKELERLIRGIYQLR